MGNTNTPPPGQRQGTLSIKVDSKTLPPAQVAGLFQLGRVEDTVELLIATMPLITIAQAMKTPEEDTDVQATTVARFQMSMSAFLRLHEKVNDLFNRIPEPVKNKGMLMEEAK